VLIRLKFKPPIGRKLKIRGQHRDEEWYVESRVGGEEEGSGSQVGEKEVNAAKKLCTDGMRAGS